MQKKYNAISWQKPCFWGNEETYVADAVRSTWISDGEYIRKFEKEFSEIQNNYLLIFENLSNDNNNHPNNTNSLHQFLYF